MNRSFLYRDEVTQEDDSFSVFLNVINSFFDKAHIAFFGAKPIKPHYSLSIYQNLMTIT